MKRLLTLATLFFAVLAAQAQIMITSINTTPESCPGACDGTMEIFVSGETPPVMYDIGFGSQPSNTFTGLCAGTYNVTVTDALPSTDMTTETITSPPSMASTYTIMSQETCPGNCDGEIMLFTTGGTPPYTVIHPITATPIMYTSSTIISGLCGGTYTLPISDQMGCSDFVVATMLSDPPPTFTASVTDESSPGSCDGSITANGSGGPSPFMYSNDCGITWQTSNVFSGLCAGSYDVMTMNANGCTSTCDTYTVASGTGCAITSTTSVVDVTCNGNCDGELFISTTGGTPPYTISGPWGIVTYTSATVITGLCAGTYTAVVEDAMGCQEFPVFVITEPAPISYTPTITDESSPGACDGSIDFGTVSGGTPPYQYSIDCGATFSPAVVYPGLCAGTYMLMIVDANGCATPCQTYNLNSGSGCAVVSTVSTTDVNCNGDCDGEAFVTTTGGTPPYTISGPWGVLTYTSAISITGLCAGVYTPVVMDAMGCVENITFTINEPPAITSVANGTDPSGPGSCDGLAVATSTGGTPGYTYEWYDCSVTPMMAIGLTGATAPSLCAGMYAAVVTDANGCMDTTNCVTLVDPVGIWESSASELLGIYPNPNTGQFTIALPDISDEMTMAITDINGRLVMDEMVIVNPSGEIVLDLSVEMGTYLVQLRSEQYTSYSILVIER